LAQSGVPQGLQRVLVARRILVDREQPMSGSRGPNLLAKRFNREFREWQLRDQIHRVLFIGISSLLTGRPDSVTIRMLLRKYAGAWNSIRGRLRPAHIVGSKQTLHLNRKFHAGNHRHV
jgi:hypothetical protein